MNYKITLIVGLPGSGKTTLAQSMLNSDTFLIDDPSRNKHIFQEAVESLKSNIIICDPLLTFTKVDSVISFLKRKFGNDVDFEWIYFDNDPDQAWENHEHRNLTEYRNLNKRGFEEMSKKYIIPNGATVIPVYRSK